MYKQLYSTVSMSPKVNNPENIKTNCFSLDEKRKVYQINFKLDDANKVITNELNKILKKYKLRNKKILVIGLGNQDILSDSLGIQVLNKIDIKTTFLDKNLVYLLSPCQIKLNPFFLINNFVNCIKPEYIILIDSMVTSDISKIGTCIEVNNFGTICSERLKYNKEINELTFNLPILFIGVPTILRKNNLYTTLDIKNIIDKLSIVISDSLKKII